MTHEELLKEDFAWVLYQNFLTNLVLHKQKPIRALQYDNNSKMQTIVIFKECQNGNMSAKKLTATKPDMVFVRSWLSKDFPELEFEICKE
jgi:predicted N-acyltransferase